VGSSHGYLHQDRCGPMILLEPTESKMWETGSCEQKNIGIGSMAFAVRDSIIRPCFCCGDRGVGKTYIS